DADEPGHPAWDNAAARLELPRGLRCSSGGGGPSTRRTPARPVRSGWGRPRLRGARPHAPGGCFQGRLRRYRLRRGGGGGRAGRVRQGVAGALALPPRRGVPTLAAEDRRERGAEPPPRRRAARRARAARGTRGLRGGGPLSGGISPRPRAPRRAARGGRNVARSGAARDRVPVLPRALGGGDGGGAGCPARNGQVAHGTGARAPARGGRRVSLERDLRALA